MKPEIAAIAEALKGEPDVVAAWVFGSVARGRERPDSDIDVAILRGRPSTGTLADQPFELADRLSRVSGRTADVVVVDDADPDLVHRVLREGTLVLERDRRSRVAFEVRMRHLYFDLLPWRTRIREAALRKARELSR